MANDTKVGMIAAMQSAGSPAKSLKDQYEATQQARRIAETRVGGLSREQAQSYLAQRKSVDLQTQDLVAALSVRR